MERVATNGIELAVDVHGEGRPVVLLHGWPDSHALWRHQVPILNAAGWRTIAPDLRGFGASSKPEPVASYSIGSSLRDVVGLLDHYGIERAQVVGHDWGAALAWALAAFVPERVERLVALSVGHPTAFATAGLAQRERSWYMLAFQFVGVAERWLSENDFEHFRHWAGHPDVDEVIERLRDPAALTASLNWYRANVGPESLVAPAPALPLITCPTLGVWSTGDRALTEQQMTGSQPYVSGQWRYERIEGAGHWLPLEVAPVVGDLLTEFLV